MSHEVGKGDSSPWDVRAVKLAREEGSRRIVIGLKYLPFVFMGGIATRVLYVNYD